MSNVALILWVLLATVLLILLTAATRPDSFRLERSTHISATPDKVVPLVADFHRWAEWSPWEHIDPSMQRSYSGPASGVGAIYEWTATGTQVTWAMYGPSPYISKLMGLVFNMDKMVGKDFEKGLEAMRGVATAPHPHPQ